MPPFKVRHQIAALTVPLAGSGTLSGRECPCQNVGVYTDIRLFQLLSPVAYEPRKSGYHNIQKHPHRGSESLSESLLLHVFSINRK